MNLLVLFRSRLEWCNYTCHYCPWNANQTRVSPEAFRQDEARVHRVVSRVAELPRAVEFFITPKAEYLVLPYWREAVIRLLHLPQISRVTIQTNLSFDLAPFLDQVPEKKLALWTTFHPSEVSSVEEENLHAKWELLRQRGILFSVGIVGTSENVAPAQRLRSRLDPSITLWINAYKRQPNTLREQDLDIFRSLDPTFDRNNQVFPSLGRLCDAGRRAVTLDDEGDLRRCFFVGQVLGNLFRDGWQTLDRSEPCPVATCHCYVGQMHIPELGFRSLYGENLAVRIPTNHIPNRAERL